MAEVAGIPYQAEGCEDAAVAHHTPLTEGVVLQLPAQPDAQIVSGGGYEIPPQLTPEEAEHLLARGPYVGRLAAQKTLRRFVQRATLAVGAIGPELPEYVGTNVQVTLKQRASELADFELQWVREHPLPAPKHQENGTSAAGENVTESDASSATGTAKPKSGRGGIRRPTYGIVGSSRGASSLAWQDRGECLKVDPEEFFAESPTAVAAAKDLCRRCVVSDECLDYALKNREGHGVWGGMGTEERKALITRAG